MFRRVVALTMLASFMAMATSGAMMFVVEKPSFTIQMRPVHKVFGLLMVIAAIAHITLNFCSIRAHLKLRSGVVAAAIPSVLPVLLYAAAINNAVPPDLARQMDAAAARVEERGK